LTFASFLAAFDIGKARDDSGKEIEINDEYEDFGFLRCVEFSAFALMTLIWHTLLLFI